MSSVQATGVLSPSPRSPLMNVNWGVRRHGLEEFPPMLGVDEFAVVNPDFWSGTPEEQRAFQGWYRFSDVSSLCYSFIIRSNILLFFCSGSIASSRITTPSQNGLWYLPTTIIISCGVMLIVRITCSGWN